MDALTTVQKTIKPLAKIGAIFGVLAGVGVGVWFYLDNIWKPSVKVISVDWQKNIAQIETTDFFFKKHIKTLYAGSAISAGAHWAVTFASDDEGNNKRIELVKNDITYQTLSLQKEA